MDYVSRGPAQLNTAVAANRLGVQHRMVRSARLIRPPPTGHEADGKASGYQTRERRGPWDRVCRGLRGRAEVRGGAYPGLCKNVGASVSY